MHLECNSQDCEQICDAKVCNLTCSGRRCETQSWTGKGQVCNTTIRVFATKISTGHGTEAYSEYNDTLNT